MPASTSIVDSRHWIDYLGVKALRSTHPGVRKLKRLQRGHNSAHGNKVWRSSFVLMDYLTTYPPEPNSQVLDIGCGWGLPGIFLPKNMACRSPALTLMRLCSHFLSLQASANDCHINFEARGFESLSKEELTAYTTIIGTDICFWDEMTAPLFDLLGLALEAGVEQIIIADLGRPPFWDLVDRSVQSFSAEVVVRRIYQPWKTEKYILIVDQT